MAHILVVDDDDILAELASRILIGAGYGCGFVCDTVAAQQVLARRKPDLVLLDQNLPGENGTALLRRMRLSPRLYDIPVMMLTGVYGENEEQIAYHHGAKDYIRKPFTAKHLVHRVNRTLRLHGCAPRQEEFPLCQPAQAVLPKRML
ncbi:MAG: response regulator [Erythrobacter sp.]|nr:MAG: response regulator [Erythrobacter sp.]